MTEKRDELCLVQGLVHRGQWGTPSENRLRYSFLIRELIRRSREHRERIMGYCAPGVARQRLP